MHAFEVLGDPVRRRIIELLADGENTSGAIVEIIRDEFGITQAAVSQHLRVLRESGFACVRPEGARRYYKISHEPLREIDTWLERFRAYWEPKMDALATEIARGKKRRSATKRTLSRKPRPKD